MKRTHITQSTFLLYLLDELNENDNKYVENHLKTCLDCHNRLENEAQFLKTIQYQQQYEPSENQLTKNRNRLFRTLRRRFSHSAEKSRFNDFIESVLLQFNSRKLAMPVALFLMGLLVGRLVLPKNDMPAQMTTSIDFSLLEQNPVSNFQIIPLDPNFEKIEIKFKTMQSHVLQGHLSEPDIQKILSYALIYIPRDDIKLKTIDLLDVERKDNAVENALLHVLEKDQNPGIRLKAIKLLKHFPINERMKDILVRTLLKDENQGVRVQAANVLSEVPDQNVYSILRKKANEDEYIRYLVSQINDLNNPLNKQTSL